MSDMKSMKPFLSTDKKPVAEWALLHCRDRENGFNLFHKVSSHVLPKLDPNTGFFVLGSTCNRRVSRALEECVTFKTWEEYYTAGDDTSSSVSVMFLSTALKVLPSYFTNEFQMDQMLMLHNCFFENWRSGPYTTSEADLEKLLNNVSVEKCFSVLQELNMLMNELAKLRAMFSTPLTVEQEQAVKSDVSKVAEVYATVENAVTTHFQKKLDGLREKFDKESL